MQVAEVKKFLTIHHFAEVGVGVPFFNFKIMKPDTNYVLDPIDKKCLPKQEVGGACVSANQCKSNICAGSIGNRKCTPLHFF